MAEAATAAAMLKLERNELLELQREEQVLRRVLHAQQARRSGLTQCPNAAGAVLGGP